MFIPLRYFSLSSDQPTLSPPVAVLVERIWRRLLGSSGVLMLSVPAAPRVARVPKRTAAHCDQDSLIQNGRKFFPVQQIITEILFKVSPVSNLSESLTEHDLEVPAVRKTRKSLTGHLFKMLLMSEKPKLHTNHLFKVPSVSESQKSLTEHEVQQRP